MLHTYQNAIVVAFDKAWAAAEAMRATLRPSNWSAL